VVVVEEEREREREEEVPLLLLGASREAVFPDSFSQEVARPKKEVYLLPFLLL